MWWGEGKKKYRRINNWLCLGGGRSGRVGRRKKTGANIGNKGEDLPKFSVKHRIYLQYKMESCRNIDNNSLPSTLNFGTSVKVGKFKSRPCSLAPAPIPPMGGEGRS